MAYEQRDNEGAVWPNDRKQNDRQPDFTGKAMVNGQMMWVSMWLKQGSRGDWYSFSFKPQDEQQAPQDNGDQRRPASRQRGYNPNDNHRTSHPSRRPAPTQRPSRGPNEYPDNDPVDEEQDIPFFWHGRDEQLI